MEYKLELKALAYSVLVKMLRNSQRGIMIIQKINLFELILQSLELTVRKINGIRHQEAVKKLGVKKCNYTIKKLCLEFKSLSEWNLPLNCEKVKSRFNDSVKIFDWIEADRYYIFLLKFVFICKI